MSTTECFLANLCRASVVGPGIRSASLKFSWSSLWQKYWERNSSWVQMICAPWRAARSTSARVRFRLTAGEGEQLVCSRPNFTTEDFFMAGVYLIRSGRAARSITRVLPFVLSRPRGTFCPNSSCISLPRVSLVGP